VQEQWKTLQDAAAAGSPKGAAPRVAFLKNVLVRVPEYRRALAAVSTPRDEVGEPIFRFLALKNPEPQPAPADELAFTASPLAVSEERASSAPWVGPVWLTGDGPPALVVAGARDVRLWPAGASGERAAAAPFPGGPTAVPPSLDGVVAADLNYDYVTDGVAVWDGGSDHALRNSMYYASKPAFFGGCSWPVFGPDVPGQMGTLPAKDRFEGESDCVGAPSDLTPPSEFRIIARGPFSSGDYFALLGLPILSLFLTIRRSR
jgi:hypothetical protein